MLNTDYFVDGLKCVAVEPPVDAALRAQSLLEFVCSAAQHARPRREHVHLLFETLEGWGVCASIGPRARRDLNRWSSHQMRAWQRELLDYLSAITRERENWDASGRPKAPWTRQPQRVAVWVAPVALGTQVRHSIDGSAVGVLRFSISRLMELAGAARIVACPEIRCQRLFVRRTGRGRPRLYCSKACQQRAAVRDSRRLRRRVVELAKAAGWPSLEVAGARVRGEREWRRKVDTWTPAERRRTEIQLGRLTPKLTP